MTDNFDINNFGDENVWDLFCEGDTKGVFQLESHLGRHWSKEIKPRNRKDLAALISMIRPGTLMAKDANGKSMTQVYADRKAGKSDSPVEYLHESLEPILKETYGVLVYQEQAMAIVQKLAGFSGVQADALRKAIGKKMADVMETVKKEFMEGVEKQGIVTAGVAEEIFSWIEKSSRYSFNKSHAVAYAYLAYWSAYCKYHRRKKFYNTYLNRANRKPYPDEEKKQLINDAKKSGIEVLPPRLQHLVAEFSKDKKKEVIYYGINHIKNVGSAETKKIMEFMQDKEIKDFGWLDCLFLIINDLRINKRATIALISVGAFNGRNNLDSRQKMLYEFDSWKRLTERERKTIVSNYKSGDPSVFSKDLSEAIGHLIEGRGLKINARRMETVKDIKESLDNPFYDVNDNALTVAIDEEKFLASPLTCSKVDGLDIVNSTNMCQDVQKGMITGKAILAVEIARIKIVKTKNGKTPGQEMAFLSVEDGSGDLEDVVVFPEGYKENKDVLIEGNTVLLHGEVSKGSFIVNKATQI